MATLQQNLTPIADQTPAVVNISANEPSGVQWVPRFPGSASVNDLIDPFRSRIIAFIDALRSAGASVSIAATFRPLQRAYLMHWSYLIAKAGQDPRNVPPMAGVNIEWAHQDESGAYSHENSRRAAQAMVNAYGINGLGIAPALISRHTARSAIDMSLHWSGTLSICNAAGVNISIASTPRTGMNPELHVVGASYQVIKYNLSGVDRPH